MTSFLEQMDISEIEHVPVEARPFLISGGVRPDRQTWGFYAYGFENAFYALLDTARDAYPKRDYLHVPLVFLCRHSIELALKYTIVFVSRHTGLKARTVGHNLEKLWRSLAKQVDATGYSQKDDWSKYCFKLITNFQAIDVRADRFRYPSDLMGNPFPPDEIDIEEVGKVHWHVTGYCDAVVSMIDASSPY